jgi:serine/threonine protein kinase
LSTSANSGGPERLSEGCVIGGHVLRSLVASSEVSSLWLTDASGGAAGPCCIRTIPDGNFLTERARHRFRFELDFWRRSPCGGVLPLYECGWDSGSYFMLMRHVPEGSLGDRRSPGAWTGEKLVTLALALADVLRQVHSAAGPHGNLKPTNVFPLPDGTVLVSDFLMPLFLDELEAGSPLRQHLVHPYLSPEQRKDPYDYDTRSDTYSFGLILLQCLSGAVPLLGEGDPRQVTAEWPADMLPVVSSCLDPDRERRYADGPELYDALSRATERHAPAVAPSAEQPTAGPHDAGARVESVWLEWDAPEIASRVQQAAEMARQGRLETALDLVESLPPGTPGVDAVLDDLERRDQASAKLAGEAAQLATTGDLSAAISAVQEAEKLFQTSPAVRAVKAGLSGSYGAETVPAANVPDALERALEAGQYEQARPLLEKLLREGELTPQLADRVRRFKLGRARKAFLENVRDARRLYLRGERTVSAQRWLEAARWLAPGPDRERVRRRATEAVRGALRLDVEALAAAALAARQEAPAAEQPPPSPRAAPEPGLTPELQQKLDAAARVVAEHDRRWLLILLGIFAILVGILAGVLVAIWK